MLNVANDRVLAGNTPTAFVPAPVNLPRNLGAARWRAVIAAAARVFADSTRTGDIMLAEELTAQRQLAYLLGSGVMQTGDGPDLMRERPEFADIDLDQLRALPRSTLGGALAAFFDDNGLSTTLYSAPTPHTDDPELAYLMRRIRGSHDIWHVLTGLSIAGHDEILLHAFSLAQTGLPASIALLVFGGLKHMVLEARWGCVRSGVLAAYRRGKAASPLLPVYWERLYDQPLDQVRAELGVVPWSAMDVEATAPWRWRGPLAS
jgi:ubiquinone biosynthesis protein COQ4